MKVVFMGGGVGSRLKGVLAEDTPKPLAPVNGVPFLQLLISQVTDLGADEIFVTTCHLHEKISEFIENSDFNVEVSALREEKALGTGGAMKTVSEILDEDLFFLNGDTYVFDLKTSHLKSLSREKACISVLTKPCDKTQNGRFQGFYCDKDGKIVDEAFAVEKCISLGIYFVRKGAFSMTQPDEEKFGIDSFIEQKKGSSNFSTVRADLDFIDIGIPSDYQNFDSGLKNGKYSISGS